RTIHFGQDPWCQTIGESCPSHDKTQAVNHRQPIRKVFMNVRKLAAVAAMPLLSVAGVAHADITSDLQAQVQALQRQLDAVKAQLDAVTAEMQRQKQAQEQQPKQAVTGPYIERKPGDAVTFLVPGGGELTLYGNLDVSFDYATKGLKSDYGDMGGMPVGRMGWEPAIATKLSYLGVGGTHPLRPELNL